MVVGVSIAGPVLAEPTNSLLPQRHAQHHHFRRWDPPPSHYGPHHWNEEDITGLLCVMEEVREEEGVT